ncbi:MULTISPECIES: DUF1435 domain-containing protein [Pantoea]|jgi:hypothetical protein|uniref:DUF1435 domain-containing protein n=1 Tax=Pantoea dispersa TaxID=59814 RepID=A0A8E1RV60_9GAMM|nr:MULTISPECIES: DUF1435 domain-containing protein [Pantoea]MBK4784863.1 DUF1435 domain-containing protein [Pantoea sp. Pent]KAA6098040.1 DUF1435 domain-containing protein [Pantoea sp. B_9]KAA6113980.1 DUF1435 domain-containing protein [Pantoea sp. B_10]KAA8669589.1 DUF1435 domain-containing protein [Pantoea dispersa]KAF0855506.1 membrane protein [Pantoea dispersa 625]
MIMAMMAACGLWGVSWVMGKRLDSGWGVLLPCAAMPVFALWEPSFSQWRLVMIVALLLTVVMLFHHRLRHYLLLPSCLALAGGLAAISVNFHVI